MADPMQEMQEARDEIADIRTDVRQQVFGALAFWTFRWIIGFALIWAITAWTGRFDWLWIAGIVLALISLAVTLGFQILFLRKTAATQLKLDELTRLIDEQEHDGGTSPGPRDSLDTSNGTDAETPNGKL